MDYSASLSHDIPMTTTEPKKPEKKFNGFEVAQTFITYFYNLWSTNPQQLEDEGVIKAWSKIRFYQVTYEGTNFTQLLKELSIHGISFVNCNVEILDSGSRQIYIMVMGEMKNSLTEKTFTQTFLLTYAGESKSCRWTLTTSILMIK